MRLYGKHFICVMNIHPQLNYEDEYVALSKRCNGKTGICLGYSIKQSGDMFLVLQIEDRIEILHHSRVRFHPDEMKALEEDLIQVVAFNQSHPETPIEGHVLD